MSEKEISDDIVHPIFGQLTKEQKDYLEMIQMAQCHDLVKSMKVIIEEEDNSVPADIAFSSAHEDENGKAFYVLYVRKRSDKR